MYFSILTFQFNYFPLHPQHYHRDGPTVRNTLALIERRIEEMPSLLTTLRTRATAALLGEVRLQLDAAADAGKIQFSH